MAYYSIEKRPRADGTVRYRCVALLVLNLVVNISIERTVHSENTLTPKRGVPNGWLSWSKMGYPRIMILKI
ncbi:integrase [Xenorhabdus ishibashii]|uniref:Integrase n=1 Tax=Xenorhabdus ishibashii TaxID=1034471 RepID=A0A2D0KK36_9GAMM|nr:integrase [Xenorhabdus ishibashii]